MKKFTKLISLVLVLCIITCNPGTALLISSESIPISQAERIDATQSQQYTNYSGTIRFTFYDHFGLDTPDLVELKGGIVAPGIAPGFRQWYILPHYNYFNNAFKPFVTLISYDITING